MGDASGGGPLRTSARVDGVDGSINPPVEPPASLRKTRGPRIVADARRRVARNRAKVLPAVEEAKRLATQLGDLETARSADEGLDAKIAATTKEAAEAKAKAETAATEAAKELQDIVPGQVEREFAEAKASAEQDEARTRETVRTICSGRIPQNPVLIKARVDPAACFGDWYQPGREYPPEYSACPAMVPVFTTDCGVKHMMETAGGMNANGKRNRSAGGEMILPVVAHIPSFARIQTLGCNFHAGKETREERAQDGEGSMKLYFVGVSYGAVSKTSLVTVSSGGQMPVPHEYGRENFYELLGCRVRWARSTKQYGDIPGFHIAVPVTERAYDAKENDELFVDVNDKSACRMVVQQATMFDCAILLGT